MIGHSRYGLVLAAAAASMIAADSPFIDFSEPQRRILSKMPRGYAPDRTRKQARAADRSKKQYLLKGIRP